MERKQRVSRQSKEWAKKMVRGKVGRGRRANGNVNS